MAFTVPAQNLFPHGTALDLWRWGHVIGDPVGTAAVAGDGTIPVSFAVAGQKYVVVGTVAGRKLRGYFKATSGEQLFAAGDTQASMADQTGGGGAGGGGNVYVQQTDPGVSPPYEWWETDGSGNLVTLWVAS